MNLITPSLVVQLIIKEAITHYQLRHDNIISLLGVAMMDGSSVPMMVLPYLEYGSALKYLKARPFPDVLLKLVSSGSES